MNEIHYPPPLRHHLEEVSHPPKILPETSRDKCDSLCYVTKCKRLKDKIQPRSIKTKKEHTILFFIGKK